MAGHEQLPAGSKEFVEGMGLYFAQYDLPRIFGRILGLVMITERPLSHEEIARLLHISRGSVSTNMRLGLTLKMVERVVVPGDRRDYYRSLGDPWGSTLANRSNDLDPLRQMARRALATIPEDHKAARGRIEETLDFCDWFDEEAEGLVARWEARRAARQHPQSQDGSVVQSGTSGEA